MCKLFLISLILTASLSLAFSTNNSSCEEKKDLYELKLNINDSDVIKFAEDGWEKLVAEGRTRGAKIRRVVGVTCAKVQIADTERSYTILVVYFADLPIDLLYCVIFVKTNQTEPLSISCYAGSSVDHRYPAERDQYKMWKFFYNDKQFCPK